MARRLGGGDSDKLLFGYEIERIYGRTLDWHTNQWLSSPPTKSARVRPLATARESQKSERSV